MAFTKDSPLPVSTVDAVGTTDSTLCRLGTESLVPRGLTLFSEATPSVMVILLVEGFVRLSSTSSRGRLHVYRIAAPGQLLGLATVLTGRPYDVTAETITACRIREIDRRQLLALLTKNAAASFQLAVALSEEQSRTLVDARRLAEASSASGKLASLLLELGRGNARAATATPQLHPLTHEDLASMSGLARETVTRLIGDFRRQGLIAMPKSSILLTDVEGLSDLCS